ncbi:peptidase M16 [Dokdonia pacifica]|uniref:Zinc protease n=1 Tax=Dokdonia pacifica TaxID=1627892 RepID=A0A239BKW6_9FLAO|nr:pitrilysin family protein [Dokdonia pacifica]GGG29071.1 peptidase M16 [Dokdonia pacifica]SNS08031.1 zinc protease [Dokdonia pacifica]
MKTFRLLILLCGVSIISSCGEDKTTTITEESQEFNVPFEKFTLENGLTVVLHKDTSDPVVAVALTTHVGSAREIEGRTGFAHLFEHLLFLESENLGKGGLDKMSARIGGSGANGSTSRDRTNYFQTVPKDALEKMIWAEADKLGWFINTVTDPVLAKEKQVVKNEKRQSVDNRPYGHVQYVVDKNLYPENHPYNWQVIGSLEDLQNATLQDVKNFYNRWYTPNNTVLTIAGDFDTEQTKAWVHKYFDEIKRGEEIPALEKPTVTVADTKKLYYEDNFARIPQLTMSWPTVPLYHKDSYALNMLSQYLSDGKQAPFNQVLVDDKQLTSGVTMYNYASELAGQFRVQIRAFSGKDLDEVAQGINDAFAKFESEGIPQSAIDRIKAGQETNFYNGLSSVLGKGFQLAQYEIFANDPGFIAKDIENILAVTVEDVERVYNTYIKGQNYIATSFVPNGQVDLALKNSKLAEIAEEKIVDGAEEAFDASIVATYEKTPSSFDRSVEPPYGNTPALTIPYVWQTDLSSGMKVYGIENKEVPLVQFQISFDGGLLLESPEKVGVSNMMARLMTKGTATKTTAELEEAIERLGASINVFAGNESVVVSGNTLAKNYDATMALVEEIVLQPRWDQEEFDIVKQSVMNQIVQQQANPNSIAANEYAKLIYGDKHILSHNRLGTLASVTSITLEDLKAFYKNISPTVGNVYVVGDIKESDVVQSLSGINENLEAIPVTIPTFEMPKRPEQSSVYFYDVPDAKQSVLRFGYPALAATDPDYYPARVMNYRLGGGGFASQLTQQLREGKGYTYGIRSNFSGTALPGAFTISSGVRSNVTYDSAALVKQILSDYGTNFNEEDLEVSKSFLIKSNARAFETSGAKLGMLSNISELNLPVDYAKQREAAVRNMTVEDIKALSAKYLDPNKMIYLVVGDAKTQLKKLEQLGYGTPVLLNPKEEIKK